MERLADFVGVSVFGKGFLRLVELDPIPLKAAPARFAAEFWDRLVVLRGGEEKALEALDHPEPGATGYYRRLSLEENTGSVESQVEAREEEDALSQVEKLIAKLRSLGEVGQIIGRGIFVGTGLRQAIPADLWNKATLKFGAGILTSTSFVYHAVTVEQALQIANVEDFTAEITTWLERRRTEHGDEHKETLRGAAEKIFGDSLTVRAFNKAYAACYGRTRGRPKGKVN